jgi:ribosomal-protein-alanine N-acetyltransferase
MSSKAASAAGLCQVHIRPAVKSDVEAIYAIEVASFSSPWTREGIADEIESRSFTFTTVALWNEVVVGFIIYWAIAGEMHLINLAVAPQHRGFGVGRALMAHLLGQARQSESAEILLEVRLSNASARALYESLGFEAIGIRIGYYADNDEDALVMSLRVESNRGVA